jgi:hypothetical protein
MSESSSGPERATSVSDTQAEPIDEAIKAALAKLKAGGDLAEIERTLNVVKLGSEIRKIDSERMKAEQDAKKAAIDAGLASRQVHQSLIASMLAPLVPLTSLAAVIVTVYIASQQMQVTRDQAREKSIEDRAVREQANWKAFEDDLNKSSADALYASGTFVSRLRAFDAAGTHDAPLKDITKQFMGRLTSDSAFKDIWKIAFKETNPENFDSVVELARGRKHQLDQVMADCQAIRLPAGAPSNVPSWESGYGWCSQNITAQYLTNVVPDPATLKTILGLRESVGSVNSIIWFLSTEIADFIRRTSSKAQGAKALDVSDIIFLSVNLDDVDFSRMNLAQTAISISTVKGALLTAKQMTFDFRGVPWWEADAIDQAVLSWLILNNYPERPNAVALSGHKITPAQYQARIEILCTSKMPVCSKQCLKFGSQESIPAQCETTQ